MLNNILIAFGIGFGIGFGLGIIYIMLPVILSYFMVPPFPESYKEHIEKGDIVR